VTLYEMLGRAADPALAQRALALSLTAEPGPTVSAGIIRAVADRHPAMALDFVLGHLPQVSKFIDLSARSRFVSQLVEESGDPALVPKLQAYAQANLKADDRRPVERAIGRMQWRAENRPRVRNEVIGWLRSR
jgi:aminopeptidase N